MGKLFTSRETVVGASAMHLIDVGVDPLKDSVIYAIMAGDSITGTIIKSLTNGIGAKMPSAHNYARDYYPLGLPQGETLATDPIDGTDIAPYILAETGYPHTLLVTEHIYIPYSPVVAAYPHLLSVRGYDSSTNEISVWPAGLTFTPIPDEDVNSFPRKVEVNKIHLSADELNSEITYDLYVQRPYIVRTFIDNGDDGYYTTTVEQEWVLDVNQYVELVAIPGAPLAQWDDECLFAVYQQLDGGGTLLAPQLTWTYRLKDNLYPALHPVVDAQPDTFLPVVPIRHNNIDYTDPAIHNTPPDPNNLFSTSKKLLRRLDINFEDLGQRLNENPDIGEMDHAYVMWGVDIQTSHEPSLAYLVEFFDNIAQLQNKNELDFLADLANPAISDEPFSGYNTDNVGNFDEYGLRLVLQHDYITTDTAVGIVGNGKIGAAEKLIDTYDVTINSTYYDPETGDSFETSTDESRYRLTITSQVTDVLVKTVVVHNLKLTNNIYKTHSDIVTLDMVLNDPDEHNLIVPVQYDLASTFKLPARNALYSDSAILIINSYDKIKLKWYKTGWFKVVMIIIAFIIAAYTGQAWLVELADAIAVGVMAVVMFLLESIIVAVAIDMGMNWVVTEYGEKIGIIGAVVLTLVAMILSKGSSGASSSQFTLATPQLMLQGASALISSVNEFLIAAGEAIRNEYLEFEAKMEDRWEDLKTSTELLEFKADLNPLIFTRPARLRVLPNEGPNEFYTRCLGLPDNTMYSIHHEVPDYCSSRLKLQRDITPDMYLMNTV